MQQPRASSLSLGSKKWSVLEVRFEVPSKICHACTRPSGSRTWHDFTVLIFLTALQPILEASRLNCKTQKNHKVVETSED